MSNWKETLAAVAPTLATALGGPLAGAATVIIGKALMGDDFGGDIETAVTNADPDKLIALKNADKEFKLKAKELDIQDRSDARDMAKTTTIKPQVILSTVYSIGYFFVMYSFITGQINIASDVKAEFNMVLGVLTAAQIQIMNFWFGSSSGSKQKTDKLK